MNIIKKAFCVFFVICIIFLCSCKKNTEEINITPEVVATKMTIGLYSSENYNPLLAKTDYNRQAYALIFDSLYNLNSKLEPVCNLASDIYIENGGLSATLQIKPNVKFHDGSNLDANDVAKTIEFILNNEESCYKYDLRNISSVSVENDYTLKLFFAYHTPNIKNQLIFPIVSSEDLLKEKFPLNGTGPYKLKKEKSGKELILTVNGNYFTNFNSTIEEIYVEIIPDKITSRSLAASGIVDVFFASFYDEGLKTVTKTQSTKIDYPTDEYTFLELNYDSEIMYLKDFRKALSLAINRQKLESDTYMSHAKSVSVPIFGDSWVDTSQYITERDEETAKKLLSEIGYEDTDGDGILEYTKERIVNEQVNAEETEETKLRPFPEKLSFNVLMYSSPIKLSVFSRIKSDLKELGVELNAREVEDYEEFKELYNNKEFDMCLVTTNTGYDLDLAPFMSVDDKYSAPIEMKYNSELLKLSTTGESDLKKQVYKSLCDSFYENMPHIPLVFLKNTLIANNKFDKVEDIYINNIYFKVLNNKKPGIK